MSKLVFKYYQVRYALTFFLLRIFSKNAPYSSGLDLENVDLYDSYPGGPEECMHGLEPDACDYCSPICEHGKNLVECVDCRPF